MVIPEPQPFKITVTNVLCGAVPGNLAQEICVTCITRDLDIMVNLELHERGAKDLPVPAFSPKVTSGSP